jgi:hypothetical protein
LEIFEKACKLFIHGKHEILLGLIGATAQPCLYCAVQ